MKKETTINKIVQKQVKKNAKSIALEGMKSIKSFKMQLPCDENGNTEMDLEWYTREGDKKLDLRENEKKFKKNPFIFDENMNEGDKVLNLTFPNTKRKIIGNTNGIVPIDVTSGEILGGNYLWKKEKVDEEQFVKIYINQMSNLYNLSKSGMVCLTYIASQLKPNKDEVNIFIPYLKEFGGWKSNKQAYAGLKELTLNKIIAPSWIPGFWFINPFVVFNGNRITLIQDYVKKEKEENNEQLLHIDSKS
jgi:hypothetical protein